jgi:hypothetical protein
MPEPIPAATAVDPTDGDFHPDDIPDCEVIASALLQRLGWDDAEDLADAVIARLREHGRVVARLPSGIVRAEEIHSRVVAATPQVDPGWVDAAVEEWHRVGVQEPELLLDDQMRRILAAVVPLVARHIAGLLDELAAVVLRSAHEAAREGAGESAARFSRRSQALADAASIARGAFEGGGSYATP